MGFPCPCKIVQISACDPFSGEKLNTPWLIELLFSLSHALWGQLWYHNAASSVLPALDPQKIYRKFSAGGTQVWEVPFPQAELLSAFSLGIIS